MKCSICNDQKNSNGDYCLNNELNPNYENHMYGNGDIYDCVEFLEEKNNEPRGNWMKKWSQSLSKKNKKKYSSGFARWSKSVLSAMAFLFFAISCEDLKISQREDDKELKINLDPRLPKDDNGYYHLTINRNKWQTIHRFSGLVIDRNNAPVDVVKFQWKSSLYWFLGDTLGYIVQRGLTDQMVYVDYDTTYITGFEGHIVPTINCCSYSNANGEFNQMSGFVRTMIGDTARIEVWYGIREIDNSNVMKFSVVLD
tara:strand:+ start:12633 stop:13397 length:765 start_codon:yes stop_codon:yes gene_type:complete